MAKIYGQLEKAQLENTTSDTASHPKGMITYRTDLNQAKVSNGTAYKLLIDEDSTQTLSNKTYANPSITGAITAAQTTTPANPASGSNKLYFKADGKLYTLDSAGNEAMVGSGTGGVKNLITNGNADDTSSSIFVPYADAASTRPVDGTGGSPTVTTSMTTSTPLDGVKSFLLTKPASNVQGQGWSVPFTVDPAYRAKSLKISVDYIVNSGTFVAGGSSTESDIIWYIYDVTNSQLIEPSNIKMFSNNSSISDKFEATFQSSATGSSYRLIAHVQSVSALAYELKVDNITVSPQTYVFGTPVTDPQIFTMSITSTGASPTRGTVSYEKAAWWKDGKYLYLTFDYRQTAAGSAGTGIYLFNLPFGLQIDTNIQPVGSGSNHNVGDFYAYSDASNEYYGVVCAHSATQLRLNGTNEASRYNLDAASGFGNAITTISFTAKIPIVGWSSSVQMSDSADTRVVASRAVLTGTQSVPNSTPTTVIWNSKTYDTHGALNTSTGVFTAPVSGYYRVTSMLEYAANTTGLRDLSVNGVSIHFSPAGSLPAGNHFFKGATTVYVNAGQTISITANQSSGGSLNIGGSGDTYNHVSIELVQGPSAIAANESILARGNNGSGQAFTVSAATVQITFPSLVINSHNALAASGTFTAPAAGTYLVTVDIAPATSASSNATIIDLFIAKNGSSIAWKRLSPTATTFLNNTTYGMSLTALVKLNAGETLDARLSPTFSGGAGQPIYLWTDSGSNSISITRVGN